MRISFAAIATLAFLLVSEASSQRGPFTSPQAVVKQSIGGTEFQVDYYAPSMHGRKVMGGLVPYGEVWCTGANIATGFTLGADIQMGGLKMPKGEYSIWTLPNAQEWMLIINKETGQFHLNYNVSLDFGRTKMELKTLPDAVETFRVELRDEGGKKGRLILLWENTEASMPFTVLP
jgi:hypothetical protein